MKKNLFFVLVVFLMVVLFLGCQQAPGSSVDETEQVTDTSYKKPTMILIEGGTFEMGNIPNVTGAIIRDVTVDSFYMASIEVTYGYYNEFNDFENSADIGMPNNDAALVNWQEAVEF